jgi:CheY-like chemotaxis protein
LSSRLSLKSSKIPENREVSPRDVCDDLAVLDTVLVVDDHPSFRRFARKLLEAAGLTVVGEANDGASALAAVGTLHPDLVLLDVLLPDTTGFEVARQLATWPERPLVVLTSSRSAADLGGLAGRDAAAFIPKSELTVAAFAALVGESG